MVSQRQKEVVRDRIELPTLASRWFVVAGQPRDLLVPRATDCANGPMKKSCLCTSITALVSHTPRQLSSHAPSTMSQHDNLVQVKDMHVKNSSFRANRRHV